MGLGGGCKFVIAPPFQKKGGCTCPPAPPRLRAWSTLICYVCPFHRTSCIVYAGLGQVSSDSVPTFHEGVQFLLGGIVWIYLGAWEEFVMFSIKIPHTDEFGKC